MCIRDRPSRAASSATPASSASSGAPPSAPVFPMRGSPPSRVMSTSARATSTRRPSTTCLLYTSDACRRYA
eukprot:7630776-Alexandrium_andersonii.AAC.1